MLTLAPGVRMVGIKPEILLALIITKDVFAEMSLPCKITSIVDGDHDGGPPFMSSSHYSGTAFDCAVEPAEANSVKAAIVAAIGDEYSVTLNRHMDHVHVSYIPKQPFLTISSGMSPAEKPPAKPQKPAK